MMRSSGDSARGKTMLSFSESSMPTCVMPISRKTSIASLRIGPRQTISTFMSSQANERTHGERDSPRRRSRNCAGFVVVRVARLGQPTVAILRRVDRTGGNRHQWNSRCGSTIGPGT